MSDNLIKRRADAHFSKLPGVEIGKTITTESEAVAAAVAAKSARLKELRLARDAAARGGAGHRGEEGRQEDRQEERQEEWQEKTPGGVVVGLAEEPPGRGTQPLATKQADPPGHAS